MRVYFIGIIETQSWKNGVTISRPEQNKIVKTCQQHHKIYNMSC